MTTTRRGHLEEEWALVYHAAPLSSPTVSGHHAAAAENLQSCLQSCSPLSRLQQALPFTASSRPTPHTAR